MMIDTSPREPKTTVRYFIEYRREGEGGWYLSHLIRKPEGYVSARSARKELHAQVNDSPAGIVYRLVKKTITSEVIG